ncbi:MAG: LysR family transcriptional regulator [Sporomusaceae bacterium]|nr:LysR family transcriptional regulator [Sporomusaceae bacterium]
MNHNYLKTFLKVAELMNFSQAAQQLGYSQSTVTIQIQQLEEELGVQLFDRFGKKVYISQQGEAFLPFAQKIIKLAMEAQEALVVQQEPTGVLQVGIVESLCSTIYQEIIETFLLRYPKVDLIIKIATTLELVKLLQQNQVDVIVTLDKKINEHNFCRAIEREERIVFLASKAHPLVYKTHSVSLQDIVCEKFILTEKYCNYREVFEEILRERNLAVAARLEIGSTNLIFDLVVKGLGITLLPEICLSYYPVQQEIAILPISDCSIKLFTQLIYNKNNWVSPAKQAFINITEQYLFP